jgi:hypothetical protein
MISHFLYRETPLDICALLATRDGVTALLWMGAGVVGWRTLRARPLPRREEWEHEKAQPAPAFVSSNTEFAAFTFLVCAMGAAVWAELLVLGVANLAVYAVVDKTADLCAWGLGNHHPSWSAQANKPATHPSNDPISGVRITLPRRKD